MLLKNRHTTEWLICFRKLSLNHTRHHHSYFLTVTNTFLRRSSQEKKIDQKQTCFWCINLFDERIFTRAAAVSKTSFFREMHKTSKRSFALNLPFYNMTYFFGLLSSFLFLSDFTVNGLAQRHRSSKGGSSINTKSEALWTKRTRRESGSSREKSRKLCTNEIYISLHSRINRFGNMTMKCRMQQNSV